VTVFTPRRARLRLGLGPRHGVDSATRMAQRTAENRAALAVAGREPVDVGLLESSTRAAASCRARRSGRSSPSADGLRPGRDRIEHANEEQRSSATRCWPSRPMRGSTPTAYSQFRADSALPPASATVSRRRRSGSRRSSGSGDRGASLLCGGAAEARARLHAVPPSRTARVRALLDVKALYWCLCPSGYIVPARASLVLLSAALLLARVGRLGRSLLRALGQRGDRRRARPASRSRSGAAATVRSRAFVGA